MLNYARTSGIGLAVSIAACALALCAQSKSVLNRTSDRTCYPDLFSALGIESAWPCLRQDLR